MVNNPYFKNKLYNRLYHYSKNCVSYKRQLAKHVITFGFNVLLGILLYFLIDLFKTYPDKVPLYLFFLIIVSLSAILGGLSSALLTTGIVSLETYFLFKDFYKTGLDLTLYIQLAFFIAGAFILSYFIDLIKENKEAKKLKKQENTYARAFIQLHNDHDRALRDIKARDQFLSIVSHELKTPLTVMLLSLNSILNSIQSVSLANFSVPKLMKVLVNSERQIKWLTQIINDLLDVSLITTGRINLELEDTDLVNLSKEVGQSFSEMLKREKYKIKIHADSSVVGKWDKVRIKQAITNLVSNAIKYGEGRPIDIKIFKTGNQGKFIIKDQGSGIHPQEQKAIFDLFKRVSGAGKYKKGLGVGLFITSQIVKLHGGTTKVSSSPHKGAIFTLQLPLKKTKV